jgi:hypothetical protein
VRQLAQSIAQRPGLWVGAIVVILFGAVAYYLVTALLMPELPASITQPQIQMHQVIGQGERGTQLGWKFVADSSELSTDGAVTTYHNVRHATYYLNGKPAYELTASGVTLDMRSQSYTASGAVHVWSLRPRDLSDLRTEYLSWNNPLQMLTCPGVVRVRYKGLDVVTSHLEVNFINGTSTFGTTSIHGQR